MFGIVSDDGATMYFLNDSKKITSVDTFPSITEEEAKELGERQYSFL